MALAGQVIAAPAALSKPSPSAYGRAWSITLFLADAVVFACAAQFATLLRFGQGLNAVRPDVVLALGLCAAIWLIVFTVVGLYRRSFAGSTRDEIYAVVAALAIGTLPELVVFSVAPQLSPSRATLIAFLLIAMGITGATRALLHALRNDALAQVELRTAIVGRPDRIEAAMGQLRTRRREAILRVPMADFDSAMALPPSESLYPWLRGAVEWGASRVILTENVAPDIMPQLLRETESRGIKLAIAPPRIRPQAFDVTLERDGGLALICPRSLSICTPGATLFRRTLDLALTVPALILLAPLMALIAIAIRVDTPGPVIYRQTRIGKDGRSFEMLKFRSMPVDAELRTGPTWADPTQPRATRVGRILRRTSLDELPQLFNVARGEMALIGPRPERPYFVELFARTLPRYNERHLVPPGITGWSQITMKRILTPTDAGEKLAGDLYYLENWSPLMDCSIIVKTLAEFLFHRVA